MTRSPLIVLGCALLLSCTEGTKPSRFGARHDALSTGVVISEVYGGAAGGTAVYRHDFVELFNRGSTAVNVSNWSVQYTSDTGGGWQVTNLGNFGMLQPGRSLLVRMGTQGTTGMTLPTFDVSGGSSMSATAGKVALVSSTTQLTGTCPAANRYVDLVGYGTTANCSEGGPTANTSPTTSVSRSGNGCTETDSNGGDFTLGAPTPRNSMASVLTCTANPVDAGCLMLAAWPAGASVGGFDPAAQTTFGELSTVASDGGTDLLTLEAYFGAGLTLPSTETYTAASTFGGCDVCPSLSRGCNPAGACAKEYFSQAGSATITIATQAADAGQLSGSLTNVRFDEWDYVLDQAVPGGECVVLAAQNVDVTWGAGGGSATGGGGGGSASGGGAGGGSVTGGGSGGGTATGGGGGTPTGGDPDAGTTGTDAGIGADKLSGKTGCGCGAGGGASFALLLIGAAVLRRRRR